MQVACRSALISLGLAEELAATAISVGEPPLPTWIMDLF